MEENATILDFSHKKLDEVPQEILDHGRMLEELYLDSNDIELLPRGIFNLPKLKVLSLCDNNLCELSEFLGNLDCVETIDVSKNCIPELPGSIENCTQLLQLDASVNPILQLPDGLFHLSNLTHLILNETFMECLPEDIGKLSQLKVVELRQNQLSFLPKSMQNLRRLERLDIGNNKFIDLPIAVGYMTNLQELLADGNVIEEIPPVIGLLRNLTLLDLSMNKVESLPSEFESMESLTALYLSANELLELPENIGSLSKLETLKLDENDLLFLPSSIGRLELLEELDINTNNLEGLPCSIGQLKKLKALNLDNNCIKSLPEELGSCTSLSLLSLRSNNLVCVPGSLGQLHNLQMINLSANMLNFLPLTFLDLKNLKALWLSENQSNPCVSLETKFDEKERKDVVSCNLLPQKTWEEDESELDAGSADENIASTDENVDAHEIETVRTRGSISQSLVNKCRSSNNHVIPWYEQEFIESVDDDEVFSDKEKHAGENAAEEGCYSLNRSEVERLNSYHSFREEQQSSLQSQFNDPSWLNTSHREDIQRTNAMSSGSVDTNAAIHSFNKGSNESSLSSTIQDPSPYLSDAGGAWQENHKSGTSLVDAESCNDSDGNTSVLEILAPELDDKESINSIEQDFILNTPDEEAMRLRFNNKRQRNGNALCSYEAFKPTRFNLYTNSDEPSWSTIKRDSSLESSSPTIKKKSVTAKLNPLIGARLARDESPPACNRYSGGAENHKYTVTQKYEDKIRTLQQQRQKERSRRRNHSARNEYCVENRDLAFSKISDASPPSYAEFYKYQSNPSASLPAPSYYLISDDGDSVAIQLSDFVLGSPQVEKGKKKDKKRKDKRSEKKHEVASTPPVARFNGFAQQHHKHSNAPSHYLFNTENRPTKQNGVLQNLESHKRILQSYASRNYESSLGSKTNGEVEKEINSYSTSDNNNDIQSNTVQNRDSSRSYKYDNTHQDSVFTSQRRSERSWEENSSNVLNSLRNNSEQSNNRASSPPVRYTEHYVDNVISSNRSRTTDRQFGKKLQPTVDGNIQHVTVKSRNISRPLSPRLVIANGRPASQDVTFKQFASNCKNEDVASFLVNNIKNDVSTPSSPVEQNNLVHERISVHDDLGNVTRNISKNLVEFCNVENVETSSRGVSRQKEIQLLVTDLDAPDAACPLTRNNQQHVKGSVESDKGNRFQVLKVLSGPKEQLEVCVYRNPGLGFTIGGGMNSGSQLEGIYVVSVNPNGPSSHLLRSGDRILEVNSLNLRSVSHEHAVLFLTHNQQLDLLIERVVL